MLRIGITGGTGCGKTAVLRQIAARGGVCVDCDALYYHLLRRDDTLRTALSDAFGAVFLPDGSLDRRRLAQTVFSDEAALARLNAIVFFHVGRAVTDLGERAREADAPLFAVDAINLIESGLGAQCDVTLAVLAPEAVRLRRIMARDALDEENARRRIRAQKPEEFYRAHCRYVLENGDCSAEEFSIKANDLLDQMIKENMI